MYQKINRNLEYSLMALEYMESQDKEWISVKEMCQHLRCPFDPFSKVMQKLSDAQIIISKKGIGGGYRLNQDLENISLYKLMQALLPSTEIADCLTGDCQFLEFCNIKKPIVNLNQKLKDFYKDISVSSLFEHNKQQNKWNAQV